MELPYGQRLEKVKRPEELAEQDLLHGIWDEVNTHLGTRARSISGLVEQLGIMRFGRRPLLADTFSGSGSIPFEAARVGCDVIASDLNPIACMLSWASFNIVGASPERHEEIVREMRQIANRVDKTITDMADGTARDDPLAGLAQFSQEFAPAARGSGAPSQSIKSFMFWSMAVMPRACRCSRTSIF